MDEAVQRNRKTDISRIIHIHHSIISFLIALITIRYDYQMKIESTYTN